MMKKKLNITDLEVKSFVTQNQNDIKGGLEIRKRTEETRCSPKCFA